MRKVQKAISLSSRERVLAAMRREPVDYVPCVCGFNPLTPVQRRGRTWQFPWAPDASTAEQIAYQVEELGLDQMVAVGVSLCRPAPGVTSKVWLEGDVLHKAYSTPAGELHAAVRYNDLWPHGQDIPFYSDFNIGHYVKPWLQTEADLAALEQVLRLSDAGDVLASARPGYASAKALADRYGLATVAGLHGSGLTGAQHLFGAKELCLLTVDQPELVEAYLEYDHQRNLRGIEVLGELGVDIVTRNGFYETVDFYSPPMLERFLGARLRREASLAREAGLLTSYTVHTGVMPILDYLAGLGMDSVFGIDYAFRGVDPAKVRDAFAGNTSLRIGPSSTFHLWKGPEATRQAVREVFEIFGKTGLILSPCVSAHSIMPWASTLAMIDEWRELR